MMWRIRNLINLAPAYIWQARYRAEQQRAFDAITELRAAQAFFGPVQWGRFKLNGQADGD